MITFRLVWLLTVASAISINATAQKRKHRNTDYNTVNLNLDLAHNFKLSDSLFMHSFVAKKPLTAYTTEGEPVTIPMFDTIQVYLIQKGSYHGITGNWAVKEININLSYYIPLDSNLEDVTEIRRAILRKEYNQETGNRLKWLGILVLPFCLIGLYVWKVAPERVGPPWKSFYTG